MKTRKLAPYIETRRAGDVILCAYWRQTYRVMSVAGSRLTVQWADGSTTEHATALEARDVILWRGGR